MLADKFVSTGSDGRVNDKAGALADAKKTKYTNAEYENVKVTVFGDTAIASYLLHLKTQQADKKVLDEVYQESDVWFKAAGGWKIAPGFRG